MTTEVRTTKAHNSIALFPNAKVMELKDYDSH